MFSNGTRHFCRTDEARYGQIGYLCRAGYVKPEKSLSLNEVTHFFCELADPARQFSTHVWLNALILLIVMSRQFYQILMGGKLK